MIFFIDNVFIQYIYVYVCVCMCERDRVLFCHPLNAFWGVFTMKIQWPLSDSSVHCCWRELGLLWVCWLIKTISFDFADNIFECRTFLNKAGSILEPIYPGQCLNKKANIPGINIPTESSHKSHNALDKYPIMHHFVTEMCTHVHISVKKCCIVGYGTGALWDYHNGKMVMRPCRTH